MSSPLLDVLLANLVHPDKNVRIDAALDLGKTAERAAVPALVTRLGEEPDFFVRENVTWALVRIGQEAVPALVEAVAHGHQTARFYATHALSKLDDPRAIPTLLTLLDDAHEATAQKAIFALGRLREETTLPELIARVGTGSREYRTTVNDAIAAFGAIAIAALRERAASADADTRREIVEAVSGIAGAEATEFLVDATRDAHPDVRFAAVTALRTRDGELAAIALRDASSDDDARVRLLASRGVQPARPTLRRRGRSDA